MFQKFKIRRLIKKAIAASYDPKDIRPTLIGLVTIYGLLTPEQRIRLWMNDIPHHYAFTPNLALLSAEAYSAWLAVNGDPQLDQTIAVSPMEWLSGSTRTEMIEYLITPQLAELGRLRDMVWQGLVRGDFSLLTLDLVSNAQSILRKVIKEIPECL